MTGGQNLEKIIDSKSTLVSSIYNQNSLSAIKRLKANLDDNELIDKIKSLTDSVYHPIGTCKMGLLDDPSAVVNNLLEVIGIENLRVVDASVFPNLIGGNTNAPTIMVAERCADMIKEKWLNKLN